MLLKKIYFFYICYIIVVIKKDKYLLSLLHLEVTNIYNYFY